MRLRISALIFVVALCGICFADSGAKSANDSSDRFVTEFGEFSPPGSSWTVRVNKADGKLYVGYRERSGRNGISPSAWKAKQGWFAFIENDDRTWAYDGSEYLVLVAHKPGVTTIYDSCCGLPCSAPMEVLSRLSPAARQIVENHGEQK